MFFYQKQVFFFVKKNHFLFAKKCFYVNTELRVVSNNSKLFRKSKRSEFRLYFESVLKLPPWSKSHTVKKYEIPMISSCVSFGLPFSLFCSISYCFALQQPPFPPYSVSISHRFALWNLPYFPYAVSISRRFALRKQLYSPCSGSI